MAQKILVVDDDRMTLELLQDILSDAGYVVQAAQDAMQGMMLATREAPDLVITDLLMPAGGGVSLIERLRRATKTMRLPIIAITAFAKPETEAQVRQAGASRFLQKPLDAAALLAAIQDLLAERGPRA